MSWMQRMILGGMILRAPEGDGGGGGGGGGTPDPKDKEISDLKAKIAEMEKATKKTDPEPKDTKDLADQAKKDREETERKSKQEKSMEAAITFNHASKDFLKANVGLIPKTLESVFTAAEKEKFDSQVEKANAIKAGIVQEFFAVQDNHDLLTAAQKSELDEFLKLTKNGKQDRVENIYAMIFEPTLETKRKIEKAKQVNLDTKDQTDGEKAYVDRMMKLSQKHYLGETK